MWPFTKKQANPPVRTPVKAHFFSFKEGQKAFLAGREVIITKVETEFWDDERFIPEIRVVYWNNAGNIKEESLSPRQAFSILSHKQPETA